MIPHRAIFSGFRTSPPLPPKTSKQASQTANEALLNPNQASQTPNQAFQTPKQTFLTPNQASQTKQVAQGQYVVSDTRCPASYVGDCR